MPQPEGPVTIRAIGAVRGERNGIVRLSALSLALQPYNKLTNMHDLGLLGALAAAGLALAVLGVNLIVRLIVFPARQDKFLGQLLDQLTDPSAEEDNASAELGVTERPCDLQECLLRHFERSATSQEILRILARHDGLTHKGLQSALDGALDQRRQPRLPLPVARRVAAILRSAGLVEAEGDLLRLTEFGRQLHSVISHHSREGLALMELLMTSPRALPPRAFGAAKVCERLDDEGS